MSQINHSLFIDKPQMLICAALPPPLMHASILYQFVMRVLFPFLCCAELCHADGLVQEEYKVLWLPTGRGGGALFL